MKFCIYLKQTEPNVSFKSQEHIFPAGIGGTKKLPLEYVSHDCNNYFSAMELQFMRNSLIALPRQFHGPGKRGDSNPKKATKSNVSLITELNASNSFGFGYISLGKPYNISQILINIKGPIQFKSDRSFGNVNKVTTDFMNNLEKFNGKYSLHEDERLTEDEFILGFRDGKWYVALSNKDLEKQIRIFIDKILFEKPIQNKVPTMGTIQTEVQQTFQFDDTFFRVCAKIIFNYLALAKGQNFVLQSCFDPLRDWIVNGGDNTFAGLLGKEFNLDIQTPKLAHKFMIVQDGKMLKSIISFYGGQFATQVNLCEDFEGCFELDGFICDWENGYDYRWAEYINRH
ncbi:hypothetical protein ACDZ28_01115 (plasmid) [Paenibacillus sp. RS8]|uniref:hypothetical protein n=1 Tax=Paenibacillus sp. RS8 TaxID=3242681 RepID=UPI0035C01C28